MPSKQQEFDEFIAEVGLDITLNHFKLVASYIYKKE